MGHMNTNHLPSTSPMIGSVATGNLGKSNAWDRVDYRRHYVTNHKSAAVKRDRRTAKRTERQRVARALRLADVS